MYSIDINDVLEFHRSSDNSRKAEKHYVTDTALKPEDCLPVSDVVITGMLNRSSAKRSFRAPNLGI